VAALVREHEEVCRDRDFKQADARRLLTQGWLLVRQGHVRDGIACLGEGLRQCDRFGTRLERPYHLTVLADAHARAAEFENGLRTLADALQLAQETGEAYYLAEMHRLRAQMLFALLRCESARQPADATVREVETALQQALDIARQQQARSLELRAAMSLLQWRLWRATRAGDADDAEQLDAAYRSLASVACWFSEGFASEDVVAAMAMLRTRGKGGGTTA